jgi:hypothetical protein
MTTASACAHETPQVRLHRPVHPRLGQRRGVDHMPSRARHHGRGRAASPRSPAPVPPDADAAALPAPQGKENIPSAAPKDCCEQGMQGHLTPHLTCGLCSKLVAAPLVVSCGHMFCGACLCDYLNKDPMCPTCQMGLRAVPVRCLAVDAVVDAMMGGLAPCDKERYSKRVADGKSAADRINKTFWWLAPQAVPIAGASSGQVGLSFSNAQLNAQLPPQQAAAMAAAAPPRAKPQHRSHPRRHASVPQLPKPHQQLPPAQQLPAGFVQPLLPLQQALLATAPHLALPQPQVPPMVPDPVLQSMLFPQQQDLLLSMLQRLSA